MNKKSSYIILLSHDDYTSTEINKSIRRFVKENDIIKTNYSFRNIDSEAVSKKGIAFIIKSNFDKNWQESITLKENCNNLSNRLNLKGFYVLSWERSIPGPFKLRNVNWINTYGKSKRIGSWKFVEDTNEKKFGQIVKMDKRKIINVINFKFSFNEESNSVRPDEIFTSRKGISKTYSEWKELAKRDFNYIGISMPNNWWENMCKLLGFNDEVYPLIEDNIK